MHNASMYCLCLHDKTLPIVKKLGYLPVGLGSENFSKDWIRDNTLENISLAKFLVTTSFSSVVSSYNSLFVLKT